MLTVPFSSAGGGDRTDEEVDCFILAFGSAEWWVGLCGGCSCGRAWVLSAGECRTVIGRRVDKLDMQRVAGLRGERESH